MTYLLLVKLSRSVAVDWLATHGLRVLAIIVAMVLAREIVRRVIPPAVRRSVVRGADADETELEKRVQTLSYVLVQVALVAVFVLGAFIILSEVGYNLAPVITGLGIGGIAIGLGAQSLVKDTINGIFILTENQFRHGDSITVAGVSGIVEEINLRRTVLRDLDGTVHSVPNSSIQVSSNHTRDYSGVSVAVLISHQASLERAIALAAETGKSVAADPRFKESVLEPVQPARIETIDEKGITLRMMGTVRPGMQAAVGFEYRRRLTEALDAAGLRYTVSATPAAPEQSAVGSR